MRIRVWFASTSLAVAGAVSPIYPGDAMTTTSASAADSGPDQNLGGYAPQALEIFDIRGFIGHGAKPRLRPRHKVPQPALPHGPCPAYGTVLIHGSQWLSGRGVDVISNGGTGADCFSLADGHRWQCGELVNRFLAAMGWSPGITGYAAQFYANASPAQFDQHPIGSGYLPVPGDIVVWSGGAPAPGAPGGFGHVAVVAADANGVLTIVEENSTISGYGYLAVDATGGIGPVGGLAAVGFLHAKANPLTPPTPSAAPSPTPTSTPPKPAVHHPQPQPTAVKTPAAPTPAPPTNSVSPTPTPSSSMPSSPPPTSTPTPSSTPSSSAPSIPSLPSVSATP